MDKLYHDLAWAFRMISPPEDYREECARFAEWIRKHARRPVKTLLNLGCGAGHHDFWLKREFAVTGADISESMLKLARELNPEVDYHPGDMRELRLNRKFDAVTIFDSIDYMVTPDDLRAAFDTAKAHLEPGGVFLTIPDSLRETFENNKTYVTQRNNGVNLTFVENYFSAAPDDSVYEAVFVMLIRRAGKLTIETDRHTLGLFPKSVWLETLRETGYEVRTEDYADSDSGRDYPMFVGVLPQ